MNATMSLKKIDHFSVMLDQIISIITPQHGGTFIDCTFGAGGYSKAILKYPNTKVIALDRDQSVDHFSKALEKQYKDRFKFYTKKLMNDKLNNSNECHHVTAKNRSFFSDARSNLKHYYPSTWWHIY